jgi:hypothetical protein
MRKHMQAYVHLIYIEVIYLLIMADYYQRDSTKDYPKFQNNDALVLFSQYWHYIQRNVYQALLHLLFQKQHISMEIIEWIVPSHKQLSQRHCTSCGFHVLSVECKSIFCLYAVMKGKFWGDIAFITSANVWRWKVKEPAFRALSTRNTGSLVFIRNHFQNSIDQERHSVRSI